MYRGFMASTGHDTSSFIKLDEEWGAHNYHPLPVVIAKADKTGFRLTCPPEYVAAWQRAGMLPVLKHFPGHGGAFRLPAAADDLVGQLHQPLALLSRGVSGIAGRTLLVNFPGNPKAIDQLFPVIAPALQHAAATLAREEPGARH